jgi:RNA methyltransferase, TrmH family
MLTKATLARLRSLKEKKHRDELGLFVVEGEKVVGELLIAKQPLVEIYATNAWKMGPNQGNVPVHQISEDEMSHISHFPTPSPVFAVARIIRRTLEHTLLCQGLTLALDGIQDPGNLGTLLRVADWFALDRVVASPDCVDVYNQKVINASMGSFSRVSFHVADLAQALAGLEVPVLGCDLEGDNLHGLPAQSNAVIVIGGEGQGISPAVRSCVKQFVTIPRHGSAESLNAGIAAAVVCDNLRRQQQER